jgi:phosphoribosylformimino-5-aminoimidazole carboxamide ribotide isomerase
MKLIPVIDLKQGKVVMAKGGKRSSYALSSTPLCRSSLPQTVLSALLDLYPFDTLYIADLDAITRDGSNLELIQALHHEYPGLTFWVDNGLADLQQLCEVARPIIGSESLASYHSLTRFLKTLHNPVLSMDFQADIFIGPENLQQKAYIWPEDVIAMTLSRVGGTSGPDFYRLQKLMTQSQEHNFFAAGGIRNHSDLQQLQSAGVAGVLLSTALHQKQIGVATLRHFSIR